MFNNFLRAELYSLATHSNFKPNSSPQKLNNEITMVQYLWKFPGSTGSLSENIPLARQLSVTPLTYSSTSAKVDLPEGMITYKEIL